MRGADGEEGLLEVNKELFESLWMVQFQEAMIQGLELPVEGGVIF